MLCIVQPLRLFKDTLVLLSLYIIRWNNICAQHLHRMDRLYPRYMSIFQAWKTSKLVYLLLSLILLGLFAAMRPAHLRRSGKHIESTYGIPNSEFTCNDYIIQVKVLFFQEIQTLLPVFVIIRYLCLLRHPDSYLGNTLAPRKLSGIRGVSMLQENGLSMKGPVRSGQTIKRLFSNPKNLRGLASFGFGNQPGSTM